MNIVVFNIFFTSWQMSHNGRYVPIVSFLPLIKAWPIVSKLLPYILTQRTQHTCYLPVVTQISAQ